MKMCIRNKFLQMLKGPANSDKCCYSFYIYVSIKGLYNIMYECIIYTYYIFTFIKVSDFDRLTLHVAFSRCSRHKKCFLFFFAPANMKNPSNHPFHVVSISLCHV